MAIKKPIPVTKTFFPPLDEYHELLEQIWESEWITNNGAFVKDLEKKLEEFLGVKNLIFVSNGTIALQIAIKAFELKGEIITTPFSYVATTSSIVWENCTPIFSDIDQYSLCMDANKIESIITNKTVAILATNVFGNVCDFDAINKIADKYNLKVIYDSAHAFDVKDNLGSVLKHGDVSTLSFHATKVFHTVEGGALVTEDDELADKIRLLRNFGHTSPTSFGLAGVNGKNSELHAAMGVLNLKYYQRNSKARAEIWNYYFENLDDRFQKLNIPAGISSYNHAYFPVVFSSEEFLHKVLTKLSEINVFPRRYFNPSLNKLDYVDYSPCPISENTSSSVLCLPLYYNLDLQDVKEIVHVINAIT